jgi:hypothetical protein
VEAGNQVLVRHSRIKKANRHMSTCTVGLPILTGCSSSLLRVERVLCSEERSHDGPFLAVDLYRHGPYGSCTSNGGGRLTPTPTWSRVRKLGSASARGRLLDAWDFVVLS